MVRTILIPNDTHIQLDIPSQYVGKEIEVTFLALDELHKTGGIKKMGDFWGVLSDEAGNALRKHIDEARDEWERDI